MQPSGRTFLMLSPRRTEKTKPAREGRLWGNRYGPADVHMAESFHAGWMRAGTWRADMSVKTLAAATIGSLIALGLLLIRPLRRKKLIASEVSALRSLGSGRDSG